VPVDVESLAFGGEGMARIDGKACFIPGALPGERVEVAEALRRRNYDRMRLLRVLRPSPDRRLPLCPHTAVCGGCVTPELKYEAQLAAKAVQVRECLARIGRIRAPELGPPLPSPVLVGYRNKMEFTFATRPWAPEGPPPESAPGPALGLHVPSRFDAVFDLESCALSSGSFARLVGAVRSFARERSLPAWRTLPARASEPSRPASGSGLLRHLVLREGKNTGEILAALVVAEDHPAFTELGPILAGIEKRLVGVVLIVNDRLATVARGDVEKLLWGRSWLTERLNGLRFRVQAQSFFQTNTWGAEVLLGVLRRIVSGRPGRHLLDLYCGAGTLGLGLAEFFDHVTGVEQVAQAVQDARRNAEENGVTKADFVEAPVEEWLAKESLQAKDDAPAGRYDGVLVDPPRAGLHPRALRALAALAPPWVLYVSCNPSTLARDAAFLAEQGYAPECLQILDLFPHTAHVESVLLMARGADARTPSLS
jgi:23S rRNA (uracil1939-C5)-methyltransferase